MEQIGFRLDDQKKVPYARTEYRLLQIVEGLCDQDLFLEPHTPLDDYMFPPPRTGADKDRNIEDVPRLALLKRKCVKWVDEYALYSLFFLLVAITNMQLRLLIRMRNHIK